MPCELWDYMTSPNRHKHRNAGNEFQQLWTRTFGQSAAIWEERHQASEGLTRITGPPMTRTIQSRETSPCTFRMCCCLKAYQFWPRQTIRKEGQSLASISSAYHHATLGFWAANSNGSTAQRSCFRLLLTWIACPRFGQGPNTPPSCMVNKSVRVQTLAKQTSVL